MWYIAHHVKVKVFLQSVMCQEIKEKQERASSSERTHDGNGDRTLWALPACVFLSSRQQFAQAPPQGLKHTRCQLNGDEDDDDDMASAGADITGTVFWGSVLS